MSLSKNAIKADTAQEIARDCQDASLCDVMWCPSATFHESLSMSEEVCWQMSGHWIGGYENEHAVIAGGFCMFPLQNNEKEWGEMETPLFHANHKQLQSAEVIHIWNVMLGHIHLVMQANVEEQGVDNVIILNCS